MPRHSDGLLTEGPIAKKLIAFAIPILLGNLFQQLYNTADSLIVGNFIGKEALAAVGSSGNLISLIIGFFNGLSIGAGVIIARHFGAQDRTRIDCAVHTTLLVGILSSAAVTVAGLALAPQILLWIGTPDDVLPLSLEYFRTYFAGAVSMVMYNMLSGVLRAMGDSRHPLYYLIAASVINVLLDLLFIGVFGWGVASAALATVISQAVSSVLALLRLCEPNPWYHLHLKSLRIHPEILRDTLRMGLPAGVQNSVTSMANVIVQSHINSFGALAMAGSGAFSKLEGFAFLPITCFALSLTTFISQNLGAGCVERARKAARFGLLCSVGLSEVIGIVFYAASPWLISAFNSDPGVIQFGTAHSRVCSLFFFLLAFSHCISGILRGAGRSAVPMVVMLSSWCALRIAYITVVIRLIPSIQVIYWAYPLTWFASSVAFLWYYKKVNWTQTKQTASA